MDMFLLSGFVGIFSQLIHHVYEMNGIYLLSRVGCGEIIGFKLEVGINTWSILHPFYMPILKVLSLRWCLYRYLNSLWFIIDFWPHETLVIYFSLKQTYLDNWFLVTWDLGHFGHFYESDMSCRDTCSTTIRSYTSWIGSMGGFRFSY